MNIIKRFYAAIKSGLGSFVTKLLSGYVIREAELRREFADELAKVKAELATVRHDLHVINSTKYGKAKTLKSAK